MSDKDRMKRHLGIKKSEQYKCKTCGALSSLPKCPDRNCGGTMELVQKKSQF